MGRSFRPPIGVAGPVALNEQQPSKPDDALKLYQKAILRHSKKPVGYQNTINATHRNEQFNPLCGDRIVLLLEMKARHVVNAAFEGESCAICTASASMLCELAPGCQYEELKETRSWLKNALSGVDDPTEHEQLLALLGVRAYPSRVRCALLPWDALKAISAIESESG